MPILSFCCWRKKNYCGLWITLLRAKRCRYPSLHRESWGKIEQGRASMAVSSISAASLLPSLSLSSPSSLNSKAKFSFFYIQSDTNTLKLKSSKPLHSSTRVHAAPEVLDFTESVDPSPEALDNSDPTALEVRIFCLPFPPCSNNCLC